MISWPKLDQEKKWKIFNTGWFLVKDYEHQLGLISPNDELYSSNLINYSADDVEWFLTLYKNEIIQEFNQAKINGEQLVIYFGTIINNMYDQKWLEENESNKNYLLDLYQQSIIEEYYEQIQS